MRSPDEIKKGLRFAETNCLYVERCEDICPYNKDCDVSDPDRMTEIPRAIVADALAYIQQLERERDALLKDLKATDPCDNCKHCGDNCKDCEEDEHWEWRGVKEETP